MVAANTATYDFMYEVTRNANGDFKVDQGAPAAKDIQFASNKPDIKPGNEIDITHAGHGLNGEYDYVGSVNTQEGGTGYIVYNISTQQYYMLTDQKFDLSHHADRSLGEAHTHGHNSDMPSCLLAGTQVATPSGPINVEGLAAGDLVLTMEGHAVPVRWIGRQTVSLLFASESSLPVCIRAGALDHNVPNRDLMVSHDHALFTDDILIQAGALLNGTSIVRKFDVPKTFVYYHVETPDHSLIMAEGTPVETFVDNVDRARFDNWDEYEALYPSGNQIEELPYPRAKAHRQVPTSIRTRLAERARSFSSADKPAAA